jgi:hypothetical protein
VISKTALALSTNSASDDDGAVFRRVGAGRVYLLGITARKIKEVD